MDLKPVVLKCRFCNKRIQVSQKDLDKAKEKSKTVAKYITARTNLVENAWDALRTHVELQHTTEHLLIEEHSRESMQRHKGYNF